MWFIYQKKIAKINRSIANQVNKNACECHDFVFKIKIEIMSEKFLVIEWDKILF